MMRGGRGGRGGRGRGRGGRHWGWEMGRGRGRYQWRQRDYRRIKVLWDYENMRIGNGFDVSRILPTLRRILRAHPNLYYGEIDIEAVVSDGRSADKIDPSVFNALDEENSIRLHDLQTPAPPHAQISDKYIRSEIFDLSEKDDQEPLLLVLLAGDVGYFEVLRLLRIKRRPVHVFLIYPDGAVAERLFRFDPEGLFSWQEFLLQCQDNQPYQHNGGPPGGGGGGGGGGGPGGGGGGGRGGGGDPGGSGDPSTRLSAQQIPTVLVSSKVSKMGPILASGILDALNALGLIHANHGEGIKFLPGSLRSTSVEAIQHGYIVLYTYSAVAGISIAYAHVTQHEKMIRGFALGVLHFAVPDVSDGPRDMVPLLLPQTQQGMVKSRPPNLSNLIHYLKDKECNLWENFRLAGTGELEDDKCNETGEPASWVCTVCNEFAGQGFENFITHLSTQEHKQEGIYEVPSGACAMLDLEVC